MSELGWERARWKKWRKRWRHSLSRERRWRIDGGARKSGEEGEYGVYKKKAEGRRLEEHGTRDVGRMRGSHLGGNAGLDID